MEGCEGIMDWLGCIRRRYICSSRCPLEGADVVENLARQMRKIAPENDSDNADGYNAD